MRESGPAQGWSQCRALQNVLDVSPKFDEGHANRLNLNCNPLYFLAKNLLQVILNRS